MSRIEKLKRKAEIRQAKAERLRRKTPKKVKIRFERTWDSETEKAKITPKIDVVEKRDCLPHLLMYAKSCCISSVKGKVHEKISEVENENVAVEATHNVEKNISKVVKTAKYMQGSKEQKNIEKYEKAKKQEMKASSKYEYESYLEKNPEIKDSLSKENLSQKYQAKKKIQKKHAEKIRKAETKTVEKGTELIKHIFTENKSLIIAAAIAGSFLLLFSALFGSCATILTGGGGSAIGTSYLSEPDEIDGAELKMTVLENELQDTIDNIEIANPDYDEYRYDLDEIGHDPFSFANYLSAKNTTFTADEVEPQIQAIFDEMYKLELNPVTETRTRTETRTGHRMVHNDDGTTTYEEYEYEVEVEYEVKILETVLTTKTMDEIAQSWLDLEQKDVYTCYDESHGGLQQFASPLDLYWYAYVGNYYGYRKNPVSECYEFHKGVDINVPVGMDVYTGHNGRVTETGTDERYGNYICIEDEEGYVTKFAHLSVVSVSEGDEVSLGMKIGKSGETGECIMPHLHIEIIKDSKYYNPLYYYDVESSYLYGEDEGDSVTPNTDVTALINKAKEYLGYPYVWGGESPLTGFDCSGFVSYVFTHSGYHNLPRTTAQGIYNQCRRIAPSEARAGDIIFFQGTYKSGTDVTHVGIYCGNGQMIHAGKPVKITSINTPYWQKHFYAFGRL